MNDVSTPSTEGFRAAPRVRARVLGPIALVVVLAAIVGGTIASVEFSQSAERESTIAIETFDLHGDLRQIAGDLSLPASARPSEVRRDLAAAIDDGNASIAEIRTKGDLSPLLSHALEEAARYLDSARQLSMLIDVAPSDAKLVTSADQIADVVDLAATDAEDAAYRSARDSQIGEVCVLLFVVGFAVLGLFLSARERRRDAVDRANATARARFEAMIEHSSDLFFLTGKDNRTEYCSPSAAKFFGMSAGEVCAAPLDELVHPDDLEHASDAFVAVHGAGLIGPFDLRVRHADGGWRILEVAANDLSLVSSIDGVAWHTRDVTDRRALEAQLERQAFEDALTGLANRALFRDRLDHALARGGRTHASVAVLMIDLDGFKAINDTMGHDAGDDALREIAARIARSARPGDTIARLGGDEFAILLENLGDLDFANEVANRLLDLVRQPFTIQGSEVRVSASVGIAISGAPESTPDSVLRDADVAMYNAKTGGRDRCAVFEPAMHARATEQLRFSQELAHALDRRQLVVYYQPSVNLDQERLEGVEALARWHHPDLGLVPPERFIPVAEQSGLIVPIGRWVLEQACEQAMAWRTERIVGERFAMEVNVSGYQLNHDSLIPDVRSILANTGLPPEHLVLEVTESILMADIDLIISRLRELKELGISIAIDDFGTGYSSLAYLRQLPIDILKIDKSFVDAASAGDPGGDAILRAILDLSSGLNLRTIAEGVEVASQARHVKDLGCESAQGYLYSRPMPPRELAELFALNAWGRSS